MKKCPFCAEEIQDEAIKCRYCNEFIEADKKLITEKDKQPFYTRTSFIVTMIFIAGPFAIPLVWLRSDTKLWIKIVATVILAVLSWFMYRMMMESIASLNEYYQILNTL